MYRNVTISVVIPCLNEEAGIAQTIRSIPDLVDEVVVVDNGSTDRTAEIARSLGAVVAKEEVRGYGSAKKRGFQTATKDVIVAADGDGTYPLDLLPLLIDAMLETGEGFVCGCRFPLENMKAMSLRNFIGNKIISWTMTILYFHKFGDGLSGMYCFRRELLPYFQIVSKGWNFSEEIKIEAAIRKEIRFRDCHIPFHERQGESKLSPWVVGFQNLYFLFLKRFGLAK
jgi:glycosyltransferase involved in cell wall biosynthesis